MHDLSITTGPGGWHTATFSTCSAATGVAAHYRATWRTQRYHIGCGGGNSPMIIFDAKPSRLPFYVDGSYGWVRDHARQCSSCGAMVTATYYLHRL